MREDIVQERRRRVACCSQLRRFRASRNEKPGAFRKSKRADADRDISAFRADVQIRGYSLLG